RRFCNGTGAKRWRRPVDGTGQLGNEDEPVTSTKPYDISKRMVLEAYRRVRANQGAAGIDGESIEMFEADLSRNLYKLWNRMASGSYVPPPETARLLSAMRTKKRRTENGPSYDRNFGGDSTSAVCQESGGGICRRGRKGS